MRDNVKKYRIAGITDEITDCQICGLEDLKSTVIMVVLDADGNDDGETYAGSTCAAQLAGWTQHQVRAKVRDAERAAREAAEMERRAAWDAERAAYDAGFIPWINETYGLNITTREETTKLRPVTGMTTFKLQLAYEAARDAKQQEGPSVDWTEMTPADFGQTTGAQLDMFAGIEGDGYGTIALDEIEDETPPVVEAVERADGTLFGLTVSDIPADGALFSVVAA